MKSKYRNKGFQHLSSWKSECCYLVNRSSAAEALISSWLPYSASEDWTFLTPAPKAANAKAGSADKRQRSGSKSRTATEHQKAGEGHEISSPPTETMTSLTSIRGTCQKCRWAGKRRIVSRRRARRRTVTRTQWTRHSPSDPNGGAMSFTEDCTKGLDVITCTCSQSSPFSVRPSAMHQKDRKALDSSEARRLGILPRNGLQRQGLIPHRGGLETLPFPVRGRQERLPRGLFPDGSSVRDMHTNMGSKVSHEVRYNTTVDRIKHLL